MSLHTKLNLKEFSYKEIQKIYFNRKRIFLKEKFNLPNYIEDVDLFNQKPIECLVKKNYYYIPFTKAPIVIDKNGNLFNLEKNKEHPYTLNKKGYKVTQLGSDSFKVTWQVHRLVGLLFIKKPFKFINLSFNDIQINHKDCNKTNNNYKNLEWVTLIENMKHAWKNNLVNTNKIVLVRNIVTNDTEEIFSISECAKKYKLDMSIFYQHLISNSSGRITRFNNVFQLKEKFISWPNKLMTEVYFNKFRPFCRFVFINILTKETLIFFSLQEACKYLNLNINILKNNKTRYGINKSTNNWIYISFEEYLNEKEEK